MILVLSKKYKKIKIAILCNLQNQLITQETPHLFNKINCSNKLKRAMQLLSNTIKKMKLSELDFLTKIYQFYLKN